MHKTLQQAQVMKIALLLIIVAERTLGTLSLCNVFKCPGNNDQKGRAKSMLPVLKATAENREK